MRMLFSIGLAISLSPIYLITWRVARRFGLRGLIVCLIVVGVVGPPRDSLYVATYPEWGRSGRAWLPSWPMPPPISASWRWGTS